MTHSLPAAFMYMQQLVESPTPVVPILSWVKVQQNGTQKRQLNVVFFNPQKYRLDRIGDEKFANFIFEKLHSFEEGMETNILAGIVRPSKPAVVEKWRGDTIEKLDYQVFSLYRGILDIIGDKDGLPVVVPQHSGIIGNVIPGLRKVFQHANPSRFRQELRALETLQERLITMVGDNPLQIHKNMNPSVQAQPGEKRIDDSYAGLSDKQIARLQKRRL